jgi:hypothetical protein
MAKIEHWTKNIAYFTLWKIKIKSLTKIFDREHCEQ